MRSSTRVVQIAAHLEASCTERPRDLYRTKRVVQIALGDLYRSCLVSERVVQNVPATCTERNGVYRMLFATCTDPARCTERASELYRSGRELYKSAWGWRVEGLVLPESSTLGRLDIFFSCLGKAPGTSFSTTRYCSSLRASQTWQPSWVRTKSTWSSSTRSITRSSEATKPQKGGDLLRHFARTLVKRTPTSRS